MTEETCAKIGALASAARTAEPAKWIASTGGSTGVEDWPRTELRLTAVDVKTGKFEVHSRLTGAPLAAAVASSCA
ncbi:MAG: patatin-like phospholipase family protein, partial [Proteobacteria bacterium]|nr:patatin-like phospholipase family protein [Pseudomonadota bacterium]